MWILCLCLMFVLSDATRPNVVFFLADDLGWNDVGFHGSNAIRTPNIDALAYSGLILQNYYVPPICTPSRAALMTGKYPIHNGMQHGTIYGMEPRGLPLTEKILPQYLKELGYKTHLVGKWHLGSYKKEYLPMNRGFDSHFGFWTGKIDMFEHTNAEHGTWGFDFRRGYEVAHDLYGRYATDVYAEEAVRIINQHNASEPLFLLVAHSAVHSGNPHEPIRAPDKDIERFKYINNTQRMKFAAVLSKLDESIGQVFKALHSKELLQNSILIFSTDNGGAASGFNDNAASNYPLKGVKNTLWEGGVRGAGMLWSPLLDSSARVASQRLHVSDWLPTILGAAGADTTTLENLDGINQWECLSKDLPTNRGSVLHNIDDIFGSSALTVGKWKLVKGSDYKGLWDNWYGPAEREGTYDTSLVYSDVVGSILQKLGMLPDDLVINDLRNTAIINCTSQSSTSCKPLEAPCLFDIESDPCEYNNLAESNPEVLQQLLSELAKLNATAIPPGNLKNDHTGDPKHWGRVWTNFADFNNHKIQFSKDIDVSEKSQMYDYFK